MENPTAEIVSDGVQHAIDRLFNDDPYLLQNDVNERSISHRLAMYLQAEFADWDVDCEYNRHHDDPKRLNLPRKKVPTDDTQATTVFPDIIVHHRSTDENLLVIEIKKTTNAESSDWDKQKLCAFKKQLGYRYALFLRFATGSESVDVVDQSFIE